jgi:hypothetical protein
LLACFKSPDASPQLDYLDSERQLPGFADGRPARAMARLTGVGRPFGPEESKDEQAIPENAGGYGLRLV